MIEKLPYYYRKSQVVADLYEVVAAALGRLGLSVTELERDLFVVTAEKLERHEADVGLIPSGADAETRRAKVIARLQDNSMLTLAALKDLVTLYEPEGCTVTEEYEDYTVTILFDGWHGVPDNIDEIKAAVEEVKPAHIKIVYAFMGNTWDDARTKIGTWNAAAAFTWDGIRDYDGRDTDETDGEL